MTIEKQATLYFREGSSDKEYRALMSSAPDGTYAVSGWFGKRGANLKEAPQCQGADLSTATKIFETLISGKTRKGYKADASSDASTMASVREPTDTGLRAQLLNAIERSQMESLIRDDRYGMMEKHDGERLMIRRSGEGALEFANRRGQQTNVPGELETAAAHLPNAVTIDGENVLATMWAFDLLETGGEDVRQRPFSERYELLASVVRDGGEGSRLRRSPLYLGTNEKTAEAERLEREGHEGLVFALLSAPASAGRPASGGSKLKFKFWESCSAIVSADNGKSSVALELIDKTGKRVPVGNVTVKANQTKPEVGDIVEIKYLYVAGQGGSLYQPELIAVRRDIAADECTTDQLKYKRA